MRAFVATVEPWATLARGTFTPSFFSPSTTERPGSAGVEGTFKNTTRPPSIRTKSVKVPPVSTPTSNREALGRPGLGRPPAPRLVRSRDGGASADFPGRSRRSGFTAAGDSIPDHRPRGQIEKRGPGRIYRPGLGAS